MYYLVVVALVAARRTAVPQQIFRLANRCFLRPSWLVVFSVLVDVDMPTARYYTVYIGELV